jgi:hypothetical protein
MRHRPVDPVVGRPCRLVPALLSYGGLGWADACGLTGGFRLYEHFRPEVPEGVQGWGAWGELRLERLWQAREQASGDQKPQR